MGNATTPAQPYDHIYAAARAALRAGQPDRAAADLDALARGIDAHPVTGGTGAALARAWAALLAPTPPEESRP